MQLSDLFATALLSLKRNRSRSLLTVLGIVIGIAAVILMLSIGRGAESLILSQVADLGSDLIFVEPASGKQNSGPPDPFIEQTLTLKDLRTLEETGWFSAATASLISTVPVSYATESVYAQVSGVAEGELAVFPAQIALGRYLDRVDVDGAQRVAVLGQGIAQDLFGDQEPIGKKIDIKDRSFRVIGVLEEQGTRFFQSLDDQITIPVTTMQRDLLGVDHVNYLSLRAAGDLDLVKEEIRWVLRDTHNLSNPTGDLTKDDFAVSTQSDAVATVGVIGTVLTTLLSSIAAISLVVGGIGIMNIMLVSVTERTREIGLRKAIGATYRDILRQFLVESVLLTLGGGCLGVMIGVGLSYGIGALLGQVVDGWSVQVSFPGIILAVIVSSLVGLVFGLYPARRAAKLNPIEALRFE